MHLFPIANSKEGINFLVLWFYFRTSFFFSFSFFFLESGCWLVKAKRNANIGGLVMASA